ncbi:MAG: NAD-dependent malic enzyme [Dehalococcoidia bacterium]
MVASITPSAGYTLTLRVQLRNIPGTLGRLATAIGDAGGNIDAVDIVEHHGSSLVRNISVRCRDESHGADVVTAARGVTGVSLEDVTDRVFALHQGGKLTIASRIPLRTRDDLAMAYTPGVGRVSQAIATAPERVYDLTIKRNAVAVLTDGSAVLGLGKIGPEAALPVMEGKAILFKEFAGIDAYPICVRAESAEHIIEVAAAISPGFGGINLEDIAAPACFQVEEKLTELLDIPIFHDDQHGTAIVVLASLLNAASVIGKRLGDMRVVVLGMGASGIASAKLLLHQGIGDIIGVDRSGIVHRGRTENMNSYKRSLAEITNRENVQGTLDDALRGADVLIGLSGPGLVEPEGLAQMARDAVVFALANPVPEIMPEEIPANVRVIATGRSDYPNQINNVLAFPGVFRGLLDSRARAVNDTIKAAAATALAGLVSPEERSEEYIIPSVFDRRVAPTVAGAVQDAVAAAGGGAGH